MPSMWARTQNYFLEILANARPLAFNTTESGTIKFETDGETLEIR